MSKVTLNNQCIPGESYNVTIERTICLGTKAFITPSMGYAGIEPGYVKVVDIITPEQYLASPHRFPVMTQELNTLVTGTDNDKVLDRDILSEDERAVYDDVMSRPWIAHQYTNNTDMGGLVFYFSIEQFIEHTSNLI